MTEPIEGAAGNRYEEILKKLVGLAQLKQTEPLELKDSVVGEAEGLSPDTVIGRRIPLEPQDPKVTEKVTIEIYDESGISLQLQQGSEEAPISAFIHVNFYYPKGAPERSEQYIEISFILRENQKMTVEAKNSLVDDEAESIFGDRVQELGLDMNELIQGNRIGEKDMDPDMEEKLSRFLDGLKEVPPTEPAT